jgi:hypothetical protein
MVNEEEKRKIEEYKDNINTKLDKILSNEDLNVKLKFAESLQYEADLVAQQLINIIKCKKRSLGLTQPTEETKEFIANYPVLKGFKTTAGFISVWCPDCRNFHNHGKEEGFRVSHCRTNTKGYKIKLFTKTELKQFLPYIKETTQEGI